MSADRFTVVTFPEAVGYVVDRWYWETYRVRGVGVCFYIGGERVYDVKGGRMRADGAPYEFKARSCRWQVMDLAPTGIVTTDLPVLLGAGTRQLCLAAPRDFADREVALERLALDMRMSQL